MLPALWIFGYGSLIWRPAFPFTERRGASIRGWARRFWQGSTDHRERGGYERLRLPLTFGDGEVANGLVYVATSANPNWLGPAPLEAIAAQVARAQGPSGPNAEYVLRLAASLRELGAEDEHVFALESLVRASAPSLASASSPGASA